MKKKIFLVFFSLLFFYFSVIVFGELNSLDEIWNYNFVRNIANGLLPYKDFNIIQMPLLFFISGIFMEIFLNELIMMRFLGVILFSLIFFMTYKIFIKLKLNSYMSMIFTLLIGFIYSLFYSFDYNYFILLLTLIMIYLEIDDVNSKKRNLLMGIIAGCCLITKQSTGFIVMVTCYLYKLFLIRKKSDVRSMIKFSLLRILGSLGPILFFVIYITVNNLWYDFFDYAILGISTFKNYVSFSNIIFDENIIIRIFGLMSLFFFGIVTFKCIKKRRDIYNKDLVFLVYGLTSFSVVYPIADSMHFMIGFFIIIIYILFIIVENKLNVINDVKNIFIKRIYNACLITLSLTCLINGCINTYRYLKIPKYDLNHYNYISISDDLYNSIKDVTEFINKNMENGKKVYILDSSAAIYMIPLDIYNKDYDMFLKGNLGVKGENGQIEKLILEKDCLILILKDLYKENWQTPLVVNQYIKDNFKRIGEIDKFDIYEK